MRHTCFETGGWRGAAPGLYPEDPGSSSSSTAVLLVRDHRSPGDWVCWALVVLGVVSLLLLLLHLTVPRQADDGGGELSDSDVEEAGGEGFLLEGLRPAAPPRPKAKAKAVAPPGAKARAPAPRPKPPPAALGARPKTPPRLLPKPSPAAAPVPRPKSPAARPAVPVGVKRPAATPVARPRPAPVAKPRPKPKAVVPSMVPIQVTSAGS